MKRIFSLSIIALSLYSSPTFSAGFDCALASTSTEKTICADAELSALDSELNSVYKSHLAQNPALKQEQREWIKNVRNTTKDSLDLIAAYKARIAAITGTNTQVSKLTTDTVLVSEPVVVNQAPPAEQDVQESFDITAITTTPENPETVDALAAKNSGIYIDMVKRGVLDFNKTITVGDALDNWKSCERRGWQQIKTENNVNVVNFICVEKIKPFMKTLKNSFSNSTHYKSFDMSSLDVKSNNSIIQFTINLDDTFQATNFEYKITWSDGKSYVGSYGVMDALETAYANILNYDPELVAEYNATVVRTAFGFAEMKGQAK